jgi:hypothetical protein
MEIVEVSDSQIKSKLSCARCWGYKKILKLDPDEDKDNLILGDAFHGGAEIYAIERSLPKAQQLAINKIMEGKPDDMQWQLQVVPAMLTGWAMHWLPAFEQDYEIIEPEQAFSYFPHPLVKYRGKKDLRARNRRTGKISIWDYKTSAKTTVAIMRKEVHINRQLAIYAIDEMRKTSVWPEEVGLVFACKPAKKGKTIAENVQEALMTAGNYVSEPVQVTPRFAQFAIDVEASDVLVAHQMGQYRELYKKIGLQAFEYIPPNFNNCYSYGKECGFAKGCHSGNPCHRTLKLPD